MTNRIVKLMVLALLVMLVSVAAGTVTAQNDVAVRANVADAMIAAPMSLAQGAAIPENAVDAKAQLMVLRGGIAGWNCLPQEPAVSVFPACVASAASVALLAEQSQLKVRQYDGWLARHLLAERLRAENLYWDLWSGHGQ